MHNFKCNYQLELKSQSQDSSSRPVIKQNTRSISSAISSQQISGKSSESKYKIAMKSFSKKSIAMSRLETVGPAIYV